MSPRPHAEPQPSLLLATSLPGLEPVAAEEIEARLHARAEVVGQGLLRFGSSAARRRLTALHCVLALDLIVADIPGDYLRRRALPGLGQKLKRVEFGPSLRRLGVRSSAAPAFRVVARVPDRAGVRFFDLQRVATQALVDAFGGRPDSGMARGEVGEKSEEIVVVLHAFPDVVVVALRLSSASAAGGPPHARDDSSAGHREAVSPEHRVLASALVRLADLRAGQLCADACYTGGVPLPPPTLPDGPLRIVAGGPRREPLLPRARHGRAAVWRPDALPLRAGCLDRVFCLVSRPAFQADRAAAEFARVLGTDGLLVVAAARELGLNRAVEAQPRLEMQRFLRVRLHGSRIHVIVARRRADPAEPPAP